MGISLTVLGVGALLWLFEQHRPGTNLPRVPGWYPRCLLLNACQALVALGSVFTWDQWFQGHHLITVNHWPLTAQALSAYLCITFIYYWWHRARHEVPFLWRWLHQVHHSPARVEVIMSFYKHPIEVLLNGVLTSSITFLVLGVSPDAAALAVLATGLAELFYHMNLRTPYRLGFFFQRPEMHRLHHATNLHRYNYSDLPLWDMAFGTFRNPRVVPPRVGFPDGGEQRLGALLRGRELPA